MTFFSLRRRPTRIQGLGFSRASTRGSTGLRLSLRHNPNELEDAPPLVSRGGLLLSNATISLLLALEFVFHNPRLTNHESLPTELLP